MLKPLLENIIFMDTEFSDLDPYEGELLSVGMVKPSGEELYLEIKHGGEVSEWVANNVIPKLTENKISRETAKKKIREFLGEEKPYLLGFINQYDDVYMSKLFLGEEKPYNYMPLDLATLLFFSGIDPQNDPEKELGLDFSKYREHHALDDAKKIGDIYRRLLEAN